MNQRTITTMVVTNDTSFSPEDFPSISTDHYVLNVTEVVSPQQCLTQFASLRSEKKEEPFPDIFFLKEDLSRDSRKEIIELRSRQPGIRQRPIFLQNCPDEIYGDTTVAALDRIYHINGEIHPEQFRPALIDLQAFSPNMARSLSEIQVEIKDSFPPFRG